MSRPCFHHKHIMRRPQCCDVIACPLPGSHQMAEQCRRRADWDSAAPGQGHGVNRSWQRRIAAGHKAGSQASSALHQGARRTFSDEQASESAKKVTRASKSWSFSRGDLIKRHITLTFAWVAPKSHHLISWRMHSAGGTIARRPFA